MYVEPTTCFPVDGWSAKRKRVCIYTDGYPFTAARGHPPYLPSTTMTFRDVQQGISDLLPYFYEERHGNQNRAGPASAVAFEVIFSLKAVHRLNKAAW